MVSPSKNKSIVLAAAVLLLVFGSYSPAQASVLTNSIFSPPDVNQLTDDSLEVVFLPDGVTKASGLATGNILQGQITFHAIQKSGNSGSAIPLDGGMQVTAVFSAVVGPILDSGVPSPSRYSVSLLPNPAFESTFGTGAMAALFEDGSSDPYNSRSAGTFSDYFSDAQSGNLMATIGFTGIGGTATGGEGWLSQVGTLSTVPVASQFSLGSFNANLNLLVGGASFGVFNDPAQWNIAYSQGSFFGTGANTQFLVNGQLFSRASANVAPNDGSGNPFPVGDNSSAFFQAVRVPEPISIVVWSLLIAGICAVRRVR